MGRFYNCGQACLAIKRVYVFDAVADEVIEAIAARRRAGCASGIGTDEGVQLGPMHTERQRAIMEDQIARTLSRGGEVVAGGGRPDDPELADGWFHEPTVVVDPPHDSPMAHEEIFGPVLPDLARARPRRGARAAPTTRRSASARRCGRATSTAPSARPPRSTRATRGSTRRPRSTTSCRSAASRRSGYGKEHGSEALDHYTDQKSVVVRRGEG